MPAGLPEVEPDHSLLGIFHYLGKKDPTRNGANVHIPDTVCYQHGSLKAWYYYDVDAGEIIKRERKYCTQQDIYKHFSRGKQQCVATFMFRKAGFLEEVTEQEATSVEFLTRDGLLAFLNKKERRPDGLLQKFVPPKTSNNGVIQVVWSPYVTLLNHRKNIHSLTDKRFSLHDRCVTHEGNAHLSVEVNCSPNLQKRFTDLCQGIAEHFALHERTALYRMILYFKIDTQNTAFLLWPASLVIGKMRRGMGLAGPSSAHGPMPATTPLSQKGGRLRSSFSELDLDDGRAPSGTHTGEGRTAREKDLYRQYAAPTKRLLLNLSPEFSDPKVKLRQKQELQCQLSPLGSENVPSPEKADKPLGDTLYCIVPEEEDETLPIHLTKKQATREEEQRALLNTIQKSDEELRKRKLPPKTRPVIRVVKPISMQKYATILGNPKGPISAKPIVDGASRLKRSTFGKTYSVLVAEAPATPEPKGPAPGSPPTPPSSEGGRSATYKTLISSADQFLHYSRGGGGGEYSLHPSRPDSAMVYPGTSAATTLLEALDAFSAEDAPPPEPPSPDVEAPPDADDAGPQSARDHPEPAMSDRDADGSSFNPSLAALSVTAEANADSVDLGSFPSMDTSFAASAATGAATPLLRVGALRPRHLRGSRHREVDDWLDDVVYHVYNHCLEKRDAMTLVVPRIALRYLGREITDIVDKFQLQRLSENVYEVNKTEIQSGVLYKDLLALKMAFSSRCALLRQQEQGTLQRSYPHDDPSPPSLMIDTDSSDEDEDLYDLLERSVNGTLLAM